MPDLPSSPSLLRNRIPELLRLSDKQAAGEGKAITAQACGDKSWLDNSKGLTCYEDVSPLFLHKAIYSFAATFGNSEKYPVLFPPSHRRTMKG